MNDSIAFLIMAHKNIDQVNRLISKLEEGGFGRCFVHVDSRCCIDALQGGVLVSDRAEGTLGSYSLVDITNRLIFCAKEFGQRNGVCFKYYCLLSGQDYPVRSVSSIAAELRTSYPQPFIDCTPIEKGNWVFNGSKNSAWHTSIERAINQRMKPGLLRKAVKAPLAGANIITRFFSNSARTLKRKGIDLHGGSAWWVLPDIMIDEIVTEAIGFGKNSKFWELRNVLVPEECFYQTILMNGEYKNFVTINPPTMVAQNCKTFAYFHPAGKPFTGHPYIFTMFDRRLLEKLSQTYFFARKFDINVDCNVLDWIDDNLLAQP